MSRKRKIGPLAREGGWITLPEASAIIGLELEQTRALLEDGILPGLRLRVGSPWKLRRADVEAWLDKVIRSTRPIRRNKPALDGKLRQKEPAK